MPYIVEGIGSAVLDPVTMLNLTGLSKVAEIYRRYNMLNVIDKALTSPCSQDLLTLCGGTVPSPFDCRLIFDGCKNSCGQDRTAQ
jgi:hypothetical protein